MSIDIKELKRLARKVAECEDRPEIADEHAEAADALWLHMHCHTILWLIEEIERLTEQNGNLLECRSAVNAAVALESEALRKDAERYRGVRRVANHQGFTDEQFDQQTDSRVSSFDAAMVKERGQ